MPLARRWEDECKYDEVFSRKFGRNGALDAALLHTLGRFISSGGEEVESHCWRCCWCVLVVHSTIAGDSVGVVADVVVGVVADVVVGVVADVVAGGAYIGLIHK